MKMTLQVKLLPSADQHTALLETMHAFNAACTWLAAHAYRERCASKFALQRSYYQELRQRFGLSAQLAIRAIAKTVRFRFGLRARWCMTSASWRLRGSMR
jgi:putative transposase